VMWVTWRGVRIDRIASAWLIRRFLDPGATFCFVAPYAPWPAEATPFDIPGVPFSHHGGTATFRTLLRAHGLQGDALQRIAGIVDAADAAGEPELFPEAVGVDAVCSALAAVVGSDEEALRVGEVLFDALYVAVGGSPRQQGTAMVSSH
jgi:hypothetical protein